VGAGGAAANRGTHERTNRQRPQMRMDAPRGRALDLACAQPGIPLPVSGPDQPLLLIQARNLITNLALPAFLTDPDGQLLFFNDAAGVLLGRSFEEVGPLGREEWAQRFGPFDDRGRPLAADDLPLARALQEGHPAQGRFHARIDGDDLREVEVSALPLLEPGHFEGALVAFWPAEEAAPGTR
jgi:PAS domain-containing protein